MKAIPRPIIIALLATACAAAVLALAWRYGVPIYHLEVGGRALEEARAYVANHPDQPNDALDRAIRRFQAAIDAAPDDGYAHRRLGQAYLLLGDNQRAVEALTRAAALRPAHPLIQIELGYAYDGLGQVERALAAYERGRYGPALEAAIVNYLKLADWKAAAGGGDEALYILNEVVLELDRGNLPAIYRAMKIYQGMSPDAAEQFGAPLGRLLRWYGPRERVLPTEPRLVAYWQQTYDALVEEGIWKPEWR